MSIFKFVSSRVVLAYSLALCGVVYAQDPKDSEFGRLFTTPEERSRLDQMRLSDPALDFVPTVVEYVPTVVEEANFERITLKGIVYRGDLKEASVAWLNDNNSYEGSLTSEYFRVRGADIDAEKVSVTIPQVDLRFDLKVGQTYESNSETMSDIVEDDEIEIVNP